MSQAHCFSAKSHHMEILPHYTDSNVSGALSADASVLDRNCQAREHQYKLRLSARGCVRKSPMVMSAREPTRALPSPSPECPVAIKASHLYISIAIFSWHACEAFAS